MVTQSGTCTARRHHLHTCGGSSYAYISRWTHPPHGAYHTATLWLLFVWPGPLSFFGMLYGMPYIIATSNVIPSI